MTGPVTTGWTVLRGGGALTASGRIRRHREAEGGGGVSDGGRRAGEIPRFAPPYDETDSCCPDRRDAAVSTRRGQLF